MEFVKNLHSISAYLTLLFILLAIIMGFVGLAGNKPFTKSSKSTALMGLIWTHIQVLIGLILYFLSPLGMSNFNGEAMKNSISRLYILEHPLTMIIGVVLITIGYSKSKKAVADKSKFKNIAIFYSLGLILILSRLPWQAWLNL